MRDDWRARWGVDLPAVSPGVVWIAASSVGEVGAAEALAAEVPGRVLITADTDTGTRVAQQVAQRSGGRIVAAARPVDHPWILAPLWAEALPCALAFVEGCWWPQLARLAMDAGVPVFRVSAKAGRWTRMLGRVGLFAPLEGEVTQALCRDQSEAEWFGGRVQVAVTGDLKSSRPPRTNPLIWTRPFIVGVSTRAGDEQALLDAIDPQTSLLLAPREPGRFDDVALLLARSGRPWARRTDLENDVPSRLDVVLLDTLGELSACLVGARAAFIGGTFDPGLGGHSGAEAAAAGVPVVAGPHRSSNPDSFADADLVRTPAELRQALKRAECAPSKAIVQSASARSTWLAMSRSIGAAAPPSSPRPWARPAGELWSWVSRTRNAAYRRSVLPVERLSVPVISVGSTNARGPGRTSTTAWLARELAGRGHRVGVAVRGYRRQRAGTDCRLSSTCPTAADLGDEGALHALAGHLVAAGPDRVACGHLLVDAGATVVLVDDGLQHRRLHRDLDLAVVDARFVDAAGMLPEGWRREPDAVPARVHGVIVHHGGPRSWPWAQPVAYATRHFGPWFHGDETAREPRGPVAAFSGVARAGDVLSGLDVPVEAFRDLGDHARIDEALAGELVRWAQGRPLVCTAKDRVRMPGWLAAEVWWRDVELQLDGVPDTWLMPP